MKLTATAPANNGWRQESPVELWEKELEALPNVRRIADTNIALIRQILAGYKNVDSYLTSPNYYLFSGRNGLWIVEDGDIVILLCWHPNIAGKIIAFPPVKGSDASLINDLLLSLPQPPQGLMVGRVLEDDAKAYTTGLPGTSSGFFETRKEEVMDWVYPVHILSTHKVSEASGQEFMYVRNRLRQLHKHSVKVLPFNAIHHSRAMENLLHRWVSLRAADQLEYENLYAPYETLFSMGMNPLSGLTGLMIFVEDQLEAIGLWDISEGEQKTGNLFVNLCNTTIKGLSELLILKCCEILRNQNIELLNIGGSETEGLDHFKRKFRPAISLNLCSIETKTQKSFPKISTWQESKAGMYV